MSMQTSPANQTLPSRGHILHEVRQIVVQFVSMPAETIEESHGLTDDLGLDSLDIIEITMEVEETFDISVSDEQQEDVRTVGDIVDGILRLLGDKRGQP
jgi:acyl carrier protein